MPFRLDGGYAPLSHNNVTPQSPLGPSDAAKALWYKALADNARKPQAVPRPQQIAMGRPSQYAATRPSEVTETWKRAADAQQAKNRLLMLQAARDRAGRLGGASGDGGRHWGDGTGSSQTTMQDLRQQIETAKHDAQSKQKKLTAYEDLARYGANLKNGAVANPKYMQPATDGSGSRVPMSVPGGHWVQQLDADGQGGQVARWVFQRDLTPGGPMWRQLPHAQIQMVNNRPMPADQRVRSNANVAPTPGTPAAPQHATPPASPAPATPAAVPPAAPAGTPPAATPQALPTGGGSATTGGGSSGGSGGSSGGSAAGVPPIGLYDQMGQQAVARVNNVYGDAAQHAQQLYGQNAQALQQTQQSINADVAQRLAELRNQNGYVNADLAAQGATQSPVSLQAAQDLAAMQAQGSAAQDYQSRIGQMQQLMEADRLASIQQSQAAVNANIQGTVNDAKLKALAALAASGGGGGGGGRGRGGGSSGVTDSSGYTAKEIKDEMALLNAGMDPGSALDWAHGYYPDSSKIKDPMMRTIMQQLERTHGNAIGDLLDQYDVPYMNSGRPTSLPMYRRNRDFLHQFARVRDAHRAPRNTTYEQAVAALNASRGR